MWRQLSNCTSSRQRRTLARAHDDGNVPSRAPPRTAAPCRPTRSWRSTATQLPAQPHLRLRPRLPPPPPPQQQRAETVSGAPVFSTVVLWLSRSLSLSVSPALSTSAGAARAAAPSAWSTAGAAAATGAVECAGERVAARAAARRHVRAGAQLQVRRVCERSRQCARARTRTHANARPPRTAHVQEQVKHAALAENDVDQVGGALVVVLHEVVDDVDEVDDVLARALVVEQHARRQEALEQADEALARRGARCRACTPTG
jgi:hypothetical protein